MMHRPTSKFPSILCGHALIGIALIIACEQHAPPPPGFASPPHDSPLSLEETYEHLRDLRTRRAYVAMRPYIDPDYRDEVIDLLIAMDELLVANAGTLATIRQACPDIDPLPFDMSAMANRLEMLSRDVELVELHENGNTGTATISIAGRKGCERVAFERRDDRWIYLPGPGTEDLTRLTRAITVSLKRLALVVKLEPTTPGELASEYQLRIGRKLELMLRQAAQAAAQTQAADSR